MGELKKNGLGWQFRGELLRAQSSAVLIQLASAMFY
jgi:hypothetical protein